ncbi:MAG: cyclic nucleotide-binding domain-containing protein, partial [Acidimicrobiales bacterium]|nr:cyclic nucleotide-binding domain-containing protein [Acidimicrobiales bacterium]
MPDTTLLSETTLFAGLAPADLSTIAAASTDRQLQRGDVIFEEGDTPDELYVVISGRIAITNRSIDGRES